MNNENNPKNDLVDAIFNFISEHGKNPTKAKISYEVALDFCKLGRNELGPLSEELFLHGPAALNGRTLFGVLITVAAVKENVDPFEIE